MDVPTTALTNADLAPTATPISTGAAIVTADAAVRAYAITTGGTGGAETIDIPNFALSVAGWTAPEHIGQRIMLYIAAQTDPGDTVNITVGGSGTIDVYSTRIFQNASVQQFINGINLNGEGSYVCLVWVGDKWAVDLAMGDNNIAGAEVAPTIINIGALHLEDDEVGGRITQLYGLPTDDPHRNNQLWNNGGVLTISAG